MAKAIMEDVPTSRQQTKDDFGLKEMADLITVSAFAETDKVRQAGLLPGNLIAKMMKDRPAFKAMVLGLLTTLKSDVEAYYKNQLDVFVNSAAKVSKPSEEK